MITDSAWVLTGRVVPGAGGRGPAQCQVVCPQCCLSPAPTRWLCLHTLSGNTRGFLSTLPLSLRPVFLKAAVKARNWGPGALGARAASLGTLRSPEGSCSVQNGAHFMLPPGLQPWAGSLLWALGSHLARGAPPRTPRAMGSRRCVGPEAAPSLPNSGLSWVDSLAPFRACFLLHRCLSL